ncbi:VOC family protein [Aureivirga marina]|uniref:VOC family protein n=1 Tax=Aureivirga marina TaxID=1182451 RepID=UPI0018CAF200|nr:VOC family protein [Aureivirga marina]
MKIISLTLFTKNLEKQIAFYKDTLGFQLLDQTENKAIFQVGKSKLIFIGGKKTHPYHFALNIPAYLENEALKWLKKKVSILKHEKDEIQTFDNWNARAIYFYDEDKNIVEFISRRNLEEISMKEFNHKSIQEISEIGISSEDIKHKYEEFSNNFPIEIYDGDFNIFCAMGSETGLFICVNKFEKTWFPTEDKALPADFSVIIEVENQEFFVEYEQEKLTINPIL